MSNGALHHLRQIHHLDRGPARCTSQPNALGSGVEAIFRFLGSGVDCFRNSLQGEGLEWNKETQCASGLGSWDTLVTACLS